MGIELAIASGVLGLVGAATSLAGGASGAAAAKAKGVAIQQTNEFNAQAEEQQAAGEIDQGAANRQDYERKGSDVVETAVADQGASGVTSEGSPLMVDVNTVRQVALGAARITAAAETRATRLRNDANLKRFAGANAIQASYLDANTSLLTGASGALNAVGTGIGNVGKFANPNFGNVTY